MFAFVPLFLWTALAFANPESCPFNAGNCPLNNGLGNHQWVQDYGYGGLTSEAIGAGATVLSAVVNPVGTVASVLKEKRPVNPECIWNPTTPLTTGAATLWNGDAKDPNRAELIAIQCAGQAGMGYSLQGSNIADLLNTTANMDELQEELMFLTATGDIDAFNECQQGLFDSFNKNPDIQRDLLKNAWQQFKDIRSDASAVGKLREEKARNSSITRADSVTMCIKENCRAPSVEDIRAIQEKPENRARAQELRGEINLLLSRIPMANRDTMRVAMENLLTGTEKITEAQFKSVYLAEMAKLDSSLQESRKFIKGITRQVGEKKLYCVDWNLKENLYRSGQLDHSIEQMGLKEILGEFKLRSQNRYGLAGTVVTEVAMIPTYFVGYGVARLALRAGASSVRAVSSTGRALAAGTRAAMLGLESSDYGIATAQALNDCDSDAFQARVTGKACNPADEIGLAYEEASLAQCLTSAALPFASAFVGTGVRIVESRRLKTLLQNPKPDDGIVVVGRRKDAALPGFKIDEAMESLEKKGIDPYSDDFVATGNLKPNERIAIVEAVSGKSLTVSQAKALEEISALARQGGSVGDVEKRLSILLRSLGLPETEVNAAAKRLIGSNTFGTAKKAAVTSSPLHESALSHIREHGHLGWDDGQLAYLDTAIESMNTAPAGRKNDPDYWFNNPDGNRGPPGPRPFRRGRVTSVFPDDISPQDVHKVFSDPSVPRLRIDEPGLKDLEIFEVQIRGNRFEVVVCDKKPDCGGVPFGKPTNIYPRCGPGVRNIPPLSTAKELAKTILASGAQLSRNSLLQVAGCGGRDSANRTVVIPQAVRGVDTTRPAPVITPELERVGELDRDGRIVEAGKLLRRELPDEQKKAIWDAHLVGRREDETSPGYFEYSAEEKTKKQLILRNAGFSAPEIRLLMEKGIAGSLPTSLAKAIGRKPVYHGTSSANLKKICNSGYLTATVENQINRNTGTIPVVEGKPLGTLKLDAAKVYAQTAARGGYDVVGEESSGVILRTYPLGGTKDLGYASEQHRAAQARRFNNPVPVGNLDVSFDNGKSFRRLDCSSVK